MYYPDQEENIQLVFEHKGDDQPVEVKYGPTFFESYHTLGPLNFIHGLNLNQNRSIQQLEESATAACSSIGPQLHLLELGNEWNFAPAKYRPANYSEADYVHEWNHKSGLVKDAVQKACPGLFNGFMAPTFILLDFLHPTWTAEELYPLGYDPQNLTTELGFHKYALSCLFGV